MNVKTCRILCVDDDADIRSLTTMALGLDPCIEARAFATGHDALALLDATLWTPDVFLLDVMMSEMTGPELLAEIRKRPAIARLPAIFMTARAGRSALAEYWTLGVIGVIMKPFAPLNLAREVREMVDQSSQIDRRDGCRRGHK